MQRKSLKMEFFTWFENNPEAHAVVMNIDIVQHFIDVGVTGDRLFEGAPVRMPGSFMGMKVELDETQPKNRIDFKRDGRIVASAYLKV
jgi:hypothetical protein